MNAALILPPTAWSFRPIAGLPLIQRIVLAAFRSGFERVVVMPGVNGPRLRQLFAADPRTGSVEVADEDPTRIIREGEVAIIPGDCLVTTATLKRQCDTRRNGHPVVLGSPSGGGGLALCSAAELRGMLDGAAEGTAVDRRARPEALGEAAPVAPEDVCVRVTDEASAHEAETRLFAELRAATADSDGPLARWVDRTASQWISRRLVYTRLRPNHITIIGTTVGLLAAWCIAGGTYGSEVLGTLLFLCCIVIDGCDGEVARLKFQETPWGGVFDVTTDNIVHVAIFLALGLGQYRHHPDGHYAVLLTLLLGGVACAAAAGYWCLLRHPQTLQTKTAPRTGRGRIRQILLRGFESLLNRDFAYLLFALAVIGRLQWFFWAAAFGTYVFAAALLWVYRWRDAD